jgi:hypothetical protein
MVLSGRSIHWYLFLQPLSVFKEMLFHDEIMYLLAGDDIFALLKCDEDLEFGARYPRFLIDA